MQWKKHSFRTLQILAYNLSIYEKPYIHPWSHRKQQERTEKIKQKHKINHMEQASW